MTEPVATEDNGSYILQWMVTPPASGTFHVVREEWTYGPKPTRRIFAYTDAVSGEQTGK